MERYLRRCLDSLIVSDENMQRLEVLVINDGSRDSSSQIAHEYETKFPQTFRVIDKENGNYGSCINRGLKEMSGKYVKVLDADDYFVTEEFERFISTIANVDVDLITSNYCVVSEDGHVLKRKTFNLPINTTLKRNEVDHNISFYKMQMHGIAYNTRLFREFDYVQSEGISYTDQEWIFTPMYHVNDVYVTDCSVYRYMLGREGQTMDPKVAIRCMSHTVKGLFKEIKDYNYMTFTNEYEKYYFRENLSRRIKYVYFNYILKNYKVLNQDEIVKIDKVIRSLNSEVYEWADEMCLYKGFIPYVKIWKDSPNGLYLKLLRMIVNCFQIRNK